MKTLLQKLVSIVLFASIYFTSLQVQAQCGAGFTKTAINWDMHFFGATPPASPLFFAFGKMKCDLPGREHPTHFVVLQVLTQVQLPALAQELISNLM